jgi:hypothetical protein
LERCLQWVSYRYIIGHFIFVKFPSHLILRYNLAFLCLQYALIVLMKHANIKDWSRIKAFSHANKSVGYIETEFNVFSASDYTNFRAVKLNLESACLTFDVQINVNKIIDKNCWKCG